MYKYVLIIGVYLLQSGYIVGTNIISDRVERQSQGKTKYIVRKDVVGLILGEVVSTIQNTSLQRMWLA
jgi:hypothetical protein